jgi:hypothetical protein
VLAAIGQVVDQCLFAFQGAIRIYLVPAQFIIITQV